MVSPDEFRCLLIGFEMSIKWVLILVEHHNYDWPALIYDLGLLRNEPVIAESRAESLESKPSTMMFKTINHDFQNRQP
jgi:hypothetical protein